MTGGVKGGKLVWDNRVSGPGVRGEELGVEKIMFDMSFRFSWESLCESDRVSEDGER